MVPVRQQSAPPTVRLSRTFEAPPERIFTAWTTAEELKRWCAPTEMSVPRAEVDLRVGGRFVIEMESPDGAVHRAIGSYREIDPPKRLVMTWRWEDLPGAAETLLTLEFHGRGGGTELVLVHEGFSPSDERDMHEKGWNGCLDSLANHLERKR